MAFPKRHRFPDEDQLTSALAFAVSHPARLHILRILDEGPRYVSEIVRTVPLGQSAVSDHIRILRRVGLVRLREQGRWNEYSLERDVLRDLIDRMGRLGCDLGVEEAGAGSSGIGDSR